MHAHESFVIVANVQGWWFQFRPACRGKVHQLRRFLFFFFVWSLPIKYTKTYHYADELQLELSEMTIIDPLRVCVCVVKDDSDELLFFIRGFSTSLEDFFLHFLMSLFVKSHQNVGIICMKHFFRSAPSAPRQPNNGTSSGVLFKWEPLRERRVYQRYANNA